jgi:hypothetical protein
VPFPGNFVETLVGHQSAQRPPARALNASIPRRLDFVIDRLLAREPESRPQSASEVTRALAAIQTSLGTPAATAAQRADTERMRKQSAFEIPRAALVLAPVALALLLAFVALR